MILFNLRLPHSAESTQLACSRSIRNVMASILEHSTEVIAFNIEGVDFLDHHSKYQKDLYPERAEQQRQRVIDMLRPWPFESVGIKVGLPIWTELWEYFYPLAYSSICQDCLYIGCKDQYIVKLNINRTIDLFSKEPIFTIGKYQFHHTTVDKEAQIKRKLES